VARLLKIPHDVGAKHKPPIRFDSRGSLTVFDLCMPSLALAELSPSLPEAVAAESVQQLGVRLAAVDRRPTERPELSFRQWTDRCRENSLKHFQPGGRARGPLWRAIADFEARSRNRANDAQRQSWVDGVGNLCESVARCVAASGGASLSALVN
jgi:hypothetical protein